MTKPVDSMTNQLTLIKNGLPAFCVQIDPPQDAETCFTAVTELSTHLRACLGHPVTWFDRWPENSIHMPAVKLVIRFSPTRRLGPETFEIDATGDTLSLSASTPSALQHAVSYFLEQAFGVRWLWPGETGTVTPRAVDVTWPIGTRRVGPAWHWRRLWMGGAFYREDDPMLAEIKVARASPATLEALHTWQRRNRLGGLNIADGHRWGQICSPLEHGKSHPEYFALVDGQRDCRYFDGKHGNQPCTSNPEVVALTADYLIAQFDARQDLDGFSLAVNDGFGFCECDDCRAIDDWAGAGTHEDSALDEATADGIPFAAPGKSLTDRMLLFANQVAERVEKSYPDKMLLVLIYSVYRNPPRRVRLHRNVIGQFATASWSHVDSALHQRELQTLRGLTGFTDKQGIYDYFINGVNGTLPRGFARVFHRCLRAYHDAGCRYFTTQASLDFGTGGFGYYLAARCLWDGDLAFDTVLRDYCESGFGAAAGEICEYVSAFLEAWERSDIDTAMRDGPVELLAVRLYDPAWLGRVDKLLKQAVREAGEDTTVLARIDFLREGLTFLERFCAAARACAALIENGAPSAKEDEWRSRLEQWARRVEVREACRAAAAERRRLRDWVAEHEDGFVISAMWCRYQQLETRGLLGDWLDVVEQAMPK